MGIAGRFLLLRRAAARRMRIGPVRQALSAKSDGSAACSPLQIRLCFSTFSARSGEGSGSSYASLRRVSNHQQGRSPLLQGVRAQAARPWRDRREHRSRRGAGRPVASGFPADHRRLAAPAPPQQATARARHPGTGRGRCLDRVAAGRAGGAAWCLRAVVSRAFGHTGSHAFGAGLFVASALRGGCRQDGCSTACTGADPSCRRRDSSAIATARRTGFFGRGRCRAADTGRSTGRRGAAAAGKGIAPRGPGRGRSEEGGRAARTGGT